MTDISPARVDEFLNTYLCIAKRKGIALADVIAAKAALELERQNDLIAQIIEPKIEVTGLQIDCLDEHEVDNIALSRSTARAMGRAILRNDFTG